MSWATHFQWQSGYPDQALVRAEETIKLASDLAHPFTQTITLAYTAMLSQFRWDVEAVDRLAEATIAHATEHGFRYYLAWAEVLRGWSRAARGAPEEGIAEIRGGIKVLRQTAGARMPYYRALLAEACGWAGRVDEALLALADAFAEVRKTEERWWEAELHRLRGELLRSEATNRGAKAEACFRTAIEVARGHRGKVPRAAGGGESRSAVARRRQTNAGASAAGRSPRLVYRGVRDARPARCEVAS